MRATATFATLAALSALAAGCGSTVQKCEDTASCDDGVGCTADTCGGDGLCKHEAQDALCGDGQYCLLDRGCFDPPACKGANDPACDDGQACTADSCDPQTGRCVYTPSDAACDDGLFCSGAERCVAFAGCVLGAPPACDDAVACTVDACDEDGDACAHTARDALCDDGMFCNGAETCSATAGCQGGAAPSCDDGDACTADSCSDLAGRCVNAIRDADGDGFGDLACGGRDCDDGDRAVNPGVAEVCNGVDDDCNRAVDEGVASTCGNCDPSCRQLARGSTVTASQGVFVPDGMIGTELSAAGDGLVVRRRTQLYNDLWVPNTNESTLSRWNGNTAREMARYRVGLPNGECPGTCCWSAPCNMPSRVAVDSLGNAYVASRGFGMQGTVTKIAANLRDCVDRNSNGSIDTSSTARPLPYGEDECVLWTAPVGPVDAVLRALTVDLGDADHPEGYAWAGSYNRMEFYRLDPTSGAVVQVVNVPVRPYGAVVTADGKLWIGTLDAGATAWVDTTTTGQVVSPAIAYPRALRGGCGASYGITADATGRLWFSGWDCRDVLAYDPRADVWSRMDLGFYGSPVGRGITIDQSGRVWTLLGGEGQSSAVYFPASAFAAGANMTAPVTRLPLPAGHSGPSGVGADVNGKVWIGHHITSQLVRVDPDTGMMDSFTGPNRIYTYSDFTGAVRRSVIGRGYYTEDVDAGCELPQWRTLRWDADAPAGSTVKFGVRTASTATTAPALDRVPLLMVAELPTSTDTVALGGAFQGAGVTPGRWLRLSIELQTNDVGRSPIVRSYELRWGCPAR